MRFPVKNCYSKVIVSQNLSRFFENIIIIIIFANNIPILPYMASYQIW